MIASLAKTRRLILALLFLPLAVGLVETNLDYWIGARITGDFDLLRMLRGCDGILCYLNI